MLNYYNKKIFEARILCSEYGLDIASAFLKSSMIEPKKTNLLLEKFIGYLDKLELANLDCLNK